MVKPMKNLRTDRLLCPVIPLLIDESPRACLSRLAAQNYSDIASACASASAMNTPKP
jgi:hypothetical protein